MNLFFYGRNSYRLCESRQKISSINVVEPELVVQRVASFSLLKPEPHQNDSTFDMEDILTAYVEAGK
jgi:hypothetical protein